MNNRLAFLVLGALALQVPAAAPDVTMFTEARVLCPVTVRLPPAGEAEPPALLVALHGRGNTAEEFAAIWDAFKRPRLVLAVPEAPYPLLLRYGEKALMGWSWDLAPEYSTLWEKADPLVARYVLDVARGVQSRHSTSGLYLLGHSQGVYYAYLAMAQKPELVRGVIAFAGLLPPPDQLPDEVLRQAAGRVRVFIAHGKSDKTVELKVSQSARERLERLGFSVAYREFPGGHTLPPDVLREVQEWIGSCEKEGTGPRP